MKRRIKRFVSSTINYPFPHEQQSLSWNFANLSTKVSKFPGMPGGFDEYLGGPAPSETGNITVGWMLISSTWAGLRVQKDRARGMAASEIGYLLIIPEDQSDESRGLRWAEARLNNLSIPETAADGMTSEKVQAQFQVVNPVWYGCEPTTDASEPAYNRTGWAHFDDGLTFGMPGLVWGGPRVIETGLNPDDSVICTNRGNHLTLPLLRFYGGTIDEYLGVRRRDARGVIREAFIWTGAMADTEVLVIDCRRAVVTLETAGGDTNAYSGFSIEVGAGFIELAAGANTLELYGLFSDLSVDIYYPDAWY